MNEKEPLPVAEKNEITTTIRLYFALGGLDLVDMKFELVQQ